MISGFKTGKVVLPLHLINEDTWPDSVIDKNLIGEMLEKYFHNIEPIKFWQFTETCHVYHLY